VTAVVAGGSPLPAARRTIDGAGRCLAPGFVDVHTHADHLPFVDPGMAATLRQGVTTVVVGNCGVSLWPPGDLDMFAPFLAGRPGVGAWRRYADYLAALARCRPAVNVATLVGHGTGRGHVMGRARRPPSGAERERLRALVAGAVAAGACGVSSGLVYAPGMYADEDELVAVAEGAAAHGGLYASHVRGEGRLLFAALDEAVAVGRRAGLPVHVSHLKLEGRSQWGRVGEAFARLAGHDATADQYPYTAWMTDLASFLPPWAPVERLPALLADAPGRRRLLHAIEHGEDDWQSSVEDCEWSDIVLASGVPAAWVGRDLAAVAADLGLAPAEAVARLLCDHPQAFVIGHAMSEDDVRAILARPEVFVASDGMPLPGVGAGAASPGEAVLDHPRSYGTFPRVLGRYVRDLGLLPLEMAVRKMTALPAARFGLAGRGRVAEGAWADLVLFRPDEVAEGGDFGAPWRPPRGVDVVVVNGAVAWEDGAVRARAGRVLRRGTDA